MRMPNFLKSVEFWAMVLVVMMALGLATNPECHGSYNDTLADDDSGDGDVMQP